MSNAIKLILFSIFFWVWLCPNGHQVYYTERDFKYGEMISAEDFTVNNKGNFYKGIYQKTWLSNPIPNQLVTCLKCGSLLFTKECYLKELK